MTTNTTNRSLHQLGVVSGLAAGAWLGAAEAPTKLVTMGFSPFVISAIKFSSTFLLRVFSSIQKKKV